MVTTLVLKLQKRDDPGKFRPLDEIIFIDGYPGYQQLLSIAENSMQVVCEIKGDLRNIHFFFLFGQILPYTSNSNFK